MVRTPEGHYSRRAADLNLPTNAAPARQEPRPPGKSISAAFLRDSSLPVSPVLHPFWGVIEQSKKAQNLLVFIIITELLNYHELTVQ